MPTTEKNDAPVSSTELYALEDIIQEFSDPASETPAEAPAPLEAPVEPPAESEQSDSEIADAIAQAVAASFDTQAPEPDPIPREAIPAEAPEPPRARAHSSADSPKPGSEPAPRRVVRRSPPDAERPGNPASERIPERRATPGFAVSFRQMLSDLHERQYRDMPEPQASLKSRERYYARIVRICGKLSPVRMILLLLMAMALAGRRFRWMQLGFLGGETGLYAALLLTALSMGASWHSLVRAVKDILFLRFSFESLLLVTTILSIAEAAIDHNVETLLPMLGIGWCLAGTAELMTVRSRLRSLRTLIAGKRRTGVRVAQNVWEGRDCIGRAPSGLSGFVRKQEAVDPFHFGWSFYALPLLLISLIISAYLSARAGGGFLRVFVTLLNVSLPVSALWSCARPYELLTRVLGRRGAIAGWFGIKALSGSKGALIYDTDLFPSGSITHKGVRVYGNQTPKLLVSYGASLAMQADNGLREPFLQLMQEVGGQLHHVNYFQVTEGGLSGQIHGVFVAVGTYSFMHLMGAVLPPDAPKSGLFIALNGQVAGLFAIKYRVKAGAADGFRRLTRERRLTLIAATRNLSVNPSYLNKWFQIPVGEILCPKVETRWYLAETARMAQGAVCGYLVSENILPYSRMISGARGARRMGMFFTALSILCSAALLIQAVAAMAGGTALIAAPRLLLIQLILLTAEELWARLAVR